MFDCRTNRTPIERLGSIGFWFGFVRLTTPGTRWINSDQIGFTNKMKNIKAETATKFTSHLAP